MNKNKKKKSSIRTAKRFWILPPSTPKNKWEGRRKKNIRNESNEEKKENIFVIIFFYFWLDYRKKNFVCFTFMNENYFVWIGLPFFLFFVSNFEHSTGGYVMIWFDLIIRKWIFSMTIFLKVFFPSNLSLKIGDWFLKLFTIWKFHQNLGSKMNFFSNSILKFKIF